MTRIIMQYYSPDDAGHVHTFIVQEDFDTVLNKISPLSAPSSTVEGRGNCVFTQESGDRVFVLPQHVFGIEENYQA